MWGSMRIGCIGVNGVRIMSQKSMKRKCHNNNDSGISQTEYAGKCPLQFPTSIF
jgi:hypothetical protein